MESLVEWYANNGKALWTTIISFFSAYGIALISLVIGIVRQKANAIAAQKASDAKLQELTAKFIERLDATEKAVIEASNTNTEKRIQAMQDIADSVNAANEALKDAEPTTASDALDSIE